MCEKENIGNKYSKIFISPQIKTSFRMCLDERKWIERKWRNLEGGRIPCLYSKIGGKEFEGEGIGKI